jgi:hypothetical protein
MTKKPKQKWSPKPPALVTHKEEDARLGLSHWPSDTLFEYAYPPGDPFWAWLDAIYATDQGDPTHLLKLIDAPAPVKPFLEDLFDRKLGSLESKPGEKTPLYEADYIERFARMMEQKIKKEDLSREAAAERVLNENPYSKITLDQLINHYSGKTGHGRRWRKRRPSP